MGATRSVAGRAGTSPLAAYERRKISQAYAQPYADLETYTAQSKRNAISEANMNQEALANTLAQLVGQQYGTNASAIMDMYGKERDDEKDMITNLRDYLGFVNDDAWKNKEYNQSEYQFQKQLELDQERNAIARASGGGSGDSLALLKFLYQQQMDNQNTMFNFGEDLGNALSKDPSGWAGKQLLENALNEQQITGDQYNRLKMRLPEMFWNEDYQAPVQGPSWLDNYLRTDSDDFITPYGG
jgi:hypothetical protein